MVSLRLVLTNPMLCINSTKWPYMATPLTSQPSASTPGFSSTHHYRYTHSFVIKSITGCQNVTYLHVCLIQVRLVRSKPRCDEFDASFAESYSVYQRYQMTVHGDTPTDCDQATFTQFLVDSPLKVLVFTPFGIQGKFIHWVQF